MEILYVGIAPISFFLTANPWFWHGFYRVKSEITKPQLVWGFCFPSVLRERVASCRGAAKRGGIFFSRGGTIFYVHVRGGGRGLYMKNEKLFRLYKIKLYYHHLSLRQGGFKNSTLGEEKGSSKFTFLSLRRGQEKKLWSTLK